MEKHRSLFIAVGLLVGVAAGTIQFATLDGLGGCIASLIWSDSTQYAPGYSIRAFRNVKVGMTKTNVYALLGRPLDVHTAGGKVFLWYARPARSHFRDRRVILQNGVVVEKNAEFYVD